MTHLARLPRHPGDGPPAPGSPPADDAGGTRATGAGHGLSVTRLALTDFRCYARAEIACDTRPVVLTGPNGAGKTNLLEAVSFLAPGRGLRRATLGEVTRRDAGPAARWAVNARLTTPAGDIRIGTGIDPDAAPGSLRRVVRIDGEAAGQAALGDHVVVVWLTPQMDRLFLEGASGRRRFLDRLVYGFHPDHAARLSAYEQAMRERSRLLKEGRGDAAWLAALEEQMAANGVAIAAARRELADRLRVAATRATLVDGAFPAAELSVDGGLEAMLADRPALACEEAFRDRLAGLRRLDASIGGASEGPHRSDLVVRHRTKDMPADQCSTGEQKALLIGLVLANARLLAADRGAPPLLLLDEVAAHLDERRRGALYEEILALGAQAWLTGTDAALFSPLGDRASHWRVEEAAIAAALPHRS